MVCPAATGPCTVPPDGECVIPSTYASLPPLAGVFAQGYADRFTVEWDTPVSYPGYRVTMLLRKESGGPLLARKIVDRDDGIITSPTGLEVGEFYEVWCRVETDEHYGDWVRIKVLISAAWNSDSQVVEHLGATVYFGTDVVLVG